MLGKLVRVRVFRDPLCGKELDYATQLRYLADLLLTRTLRLLTPSVSIKDAVQIVFLYRTPPQEG